ncbi:MAG: hypothetical protein J6K32_04545 [Clostridia bacterium]|nr:hypothetical protein [Clostridia bacterium]
MDEELEAIVNDRRGLRHDPALQKYCACCGKSFVRENNRQIDCSSCSLGRRREKERLRKRDARRKKKQKSAFGTGDHHVLNG